MAQPAETWSAYVIRAIDRHDLDALDPLIHSEIADRRRIERLPRLYFEAFRERSASPELFSQIYDAVKDNPVARERLCQYVTGRGVDLHPRCPLWHRTLAEHYFDLAQVMFEKFPSEIGDEFDLYEGIDDIVTNLREGGQLDALEFLCTLPVGKGPIIDIVDDILFSLLEADDLELDETTGQIMRDGERIHSCWKKAVDWLVAAGWTPHEEGSQEETDFRMKYDQSPLQALMCYIDDKVQPHLPDGVYVELAMHMKKLYESNR